MVGVPRMPTARNSRSRTGWALAQPAPLVRVGLVPCNGWDPGAVPSASQQAADGDPDRISELSRSYEVGIGFCLFLFVVGAILTFAVDVNTSGFSVNTVGIILMVGGLLGLLFSAASRPGAGAGPWLAGTGWWRSGASSGSSSHQAGHGEPINSGWSAQGSSGR
jgi:hypothetical protein